MFQYLQQSCLFLHLALAFRIPRFDPMSSSMCGACWMPRHWAQPGWSLRALDQEHSSNQAGPGRGQLLKGDKIMKWNNVIWQEIESMNELQPHCRSLLHGAECWRSLTGYTCLRFDAWRLYQGSNCYEGHGGSLLHYITEKISVDGCKAECLKKDHCEGISVRSGWEESPCWLYTQINLNSCVLDYPDYDFWHRLQ